MIYRPIHKLLTVLLLILVLPVVAQTDRFLVIEAKLKELSVQSPGLNEKVELSVNGVSIQEFIRGVALSNNLNVSVDPNLNVKIYNNFSNVTVSDVFLFLCKKYDLELNFIGSIMSFSQFIPLPVEAPKFISKPIKITYDKSTDQLSFDLNGDSLQRVAKELTQVTGKNVVFAPDLSNKMVSGFIQNMSFNNALDKFAFANDLKITPTNDNFYLVERKDKEAAGSKAGNKNDRNAGFNSAPGLNVKVEGLLISVDAVNTPIIDIIGAVSAELKNNYFLFSEPKGNSTLKITNVTYEEFLRYLLNGTDYTFRNEGGLYLIGDRNIEGLRATKVVQMKFRTVEKIIEVIPADLKKNVDIKAFPDLNSVILSGSQPRIDEIEAFLREVDRVVPVVVIEVLIVDVRNSKSLSTGIEAGIGTPPKSNQVVFPSLDMTLNSSIINNLISGLNGLGIVNLGKVTPNFYLSLKALETQGVLKLRSTPKLATLNGHEARMSIGKTEYYLETQTTLLGSVTSSAQTSISYKPINADLSVTINPMVSGDEQITLDIRVKQSNFTERISQTAPPGTVTRDFQSMVRVKNEEMVILGGLEENTSNDSGSGTPVLSRIPILKWFFSSRTKAKSKSKLTIFIKPTVIY